jgi:peroxiredoxin
MNRTLLAAAAAALLVAAGCKSAPSWMQVGMRAPDLNGVTYDGKPVTLAQQRGKVVAVIFFADWCPHCKGLYAAERELAMRLNGKPFAMIGVDSDDDAGAIKNAIAREHIVWPVVYDFNAAVSKAWGVTGLPTTYVIDAEGVIRAYDLTDSKLVAAVDEWIAKTSPSR